MENYIANLGILICVYSVLAITLNFIMGYAGIFSLAHAVFFGFGAYTGGFIALNYTSSMFVTLPAAMVVSAVLSLLLAIPTLRVRGEYFVAASLGLQILAVTLFSEWKWFTGGIGGLVGIPPVSIFETEIFRPTSFVFVTIGALIVTIAIFHLLVHSNFGRSLRAIRDNESAASAFGKNVPVIKTVSLAISAALAGMVGALYASYLAFINVESFMLDTSVLIMAMVIIGGTGTQLGPIVGAIVLLSLPSAITYMNFLPQSEIGAIQQIIYGAGMTLLMLFRPGGIVGSGGK